MAGTDPEYSMVFGVQAQLGNSFERLHNLEITLIPVCNEAKRQMNVKGIFKSEFVY